MSFTLTESDLGYWHESHDGLSSRVWFATDDASADTTADTTADTADDATFRFAILPYSRPL